MNHLRIWVTRMLRLGLPHHQIAFKLGVSLEDLRLNYAQQIEQVTFLTNLRILETLERLATSGLHPSATMFWVKLRCSPSKSESKNARKSHEYNDKQPSGAGPFGPEDIVFYGPNGETA